MKEQIISFETAKLAKEKGFNIPLSNVYYVPSKTLTLSFSAIESNDKHYVAPTQSLLQKWLRENFSIIVYIEPYYSLNVTKTKDIFTLKGWRYKILKHNLSNIVEEQIFYPDLIDLKHDDLFHSHEEALEEGLQQALNMIQLQTKFCQVLEVTIKTVAGTIERSIHERFRDVKVGDILPNGDQIIGRNIIEVQYSHTHELDGVVTLLTKEQLNSSY